MTPESHAGSAGTAPAPTSRPTRLAVDAPTRMFHALFALAFFGAWLTAETERLRALHITLGYTMAGLLVFRLLYGLFGPKQARLSLMWRRVRGIPAWVRGLDRVRDPRALPWRSALPLLVGASIVLLLLATVPQVLTGYATFHEWDDALGSELFEELHEVVGNGMLVLVLVHLAAVLVMSLNLRRNLAWQMVDGRVPGRGSDLVAKNRRWLAALMLIAVLGYGAWEWRQSPQGLVTLSGLQSLVLDVGGHDDDHD